MDTSINVFVHVNIYDFICSSLKLNIKYNYKSNINILSTDELLPKNAASHYVNKKDIYNLFGCDGNVNQYPNINIYSKPGYSNINICDYNVDLAVIPNNFNYTTDSSVYNIVYNDADFPNINLVSEIFINGVFKPSSVQCINELLEQLLEHVRDYFRDNVSKTSRVSTTTDYLAICNSLEDKVNEYSVKVNKLELEIAQYKDENLRLKDGVSDYTMHNEILSYLFGKSSRPNYLADGFEDKIEIVRRLKRENEELRESLNKKEATFQRLQDLIGNY